MPIKAIGTFTNGISSNESSKNIRKFKMEIQYMANFFGKIIAALVSLLKKIGYEVGDPKGSTNFKLNITDLALFTEYSIISGCNLVGLAPSRKVILLNIIVLVRSIVKNLIEQSRTGSSVSLERGHLKITLTHFGRILIESTVFIMVLVFMIVAGQNNNSNAVKILVGAAIAVTWLENSISMLERLFKTEAKIMHM